MTENPSNGPQGQGPAQPPPYSPPPAWGTPGPGEPGVPGYGPGQPYPQQPWGAPPPSTMAPGDERLWATLSHALAFVSAWVALGFVAPLVVMAIFGNRSAFVRHHAVESLNFQITALIVTVVGVVVGIITLGLGFLALGAYAIFYLVVVILAAVKANNGEWYRYPLTLRLVK